MKSIFKLGEYQKLEAVKEVPMGMCLSLPDTMRRSDEAKELVLLPKREMPKDLQVNDLITVFICKDSEDRPVATSLKPSVTLGEFAYLTVVQTTDIGAFLNWGLLKDLFLPFKEQTYRVKTGDKVLISLYIDKSERTVQRQCIFMNCFVPIQNTRKMIPYQEPYMNFLIILVHLLR